ncbi:sulfatase-like hydrolase/transferase [Winogradskyella eckloniae]|uniref:sulfatase-like hydrolase/transferase n=1 Tax=Winogradskyella eckloniae TaxID=1089306 RepID=UPI001565A5AB|nr:sulfatase-like hydrolase/transferase [Winogradskyella eckloniae]NRD19742.1 sulfatase-like hydrolase/transferase [Winogradskyella eckloniae]
MMVNRNIVFLLCILLLVSCGNDDNSGTQDDEETMQPSVPNILLVIADDMGLDATPNYAIGSQKPNMPNLQNLMANGITFTNVWANPVCSPTRASILTGHYGTNNGVTRVGHQLSNSAHILQNDMPNYATALIGKWHLSNDVNQPLSMGIDYYAGILSGGVDDYESWDLIEEGVTTTSTEYVTTKLTDLAIDWVEDQDQPWFLWMAYNAPHTPFHLPPTDLHSQGDLPTNQSSINANRLVYYLAALEALDTEMGRLLQSMTAEERDNTIIIFIGDNGSPGQVAQAYGQGKAKGSMYQGGVNVPMVISGKNVTRLNATDNNLISATDLYDTIVELSGNTTVQHNDSESFKDVLSHATAVNRDYLFSEVSYVGGTADFATRNLTHKYIRFADNTEAFFHLAEDPFEDFNLLDQTMTSAELAIYNALKTELENTIN